MSRARPRTATLPAVLTTALALFASLALAQSPPPPPQHYFNDYAGLVSADVAARLDEKLRRFDTETSNQVVVAVFPELPSPSLEDFTVRTAQAWRVGRKKLDNGVVFFVFVKDRAMRLEVGYGLEGALPDVTAKRIIDDVVVPRFRAGDFAGGLEGGIDAVMAATRGEYKPPPRPTMPTIAPLLFFVIVLGIIIVFLALARSSGATYTGRGRRGYGGPWWGGGLGGGGFSGGGGGWSGGGGFSGGGGSFGGGGASGRW